MTNELLPCPCCDGHATHVAMSAGMPRTQAYDKWCAVCCKACGLLIGDSGRRFRTKDEAIAAWNRRAAKPAEPSANTVILTRQLVLKIADYITDHGKLGKEGDVLLKAINAAVAI